MRGQWEEDTMCHVAHRRKAKQMTTIHHHKRADYPPPPSVLRKRQREKTHRQRGREKERRVRFCQHMSLYRGALGMRANHWLE